MDVMRIPHPKPTAVKAAASTARRSAGFSLIELMIALALGLVLTIAAAAVYLSSKTAFRRLDQLTTIQQSVRVAFEYLATDTRMVGHLGCFTRNGAPANSSLAGGTLATNFAAGIEGYEFDNTGAGDTYTLTSNAPNNITSAGSWTVNSAAGGVNTIPVTSIGGSGTGDGLTPGSDVLVIRTVAGAAIAGQPARLDADTVSGTSTVIIEKLAGGANCANGTARASGFCAASGGSTGSYGLIASCTKARVFSVAAVATSASQATLTLTGAAALAADPVYVTSSAEVFPMQTIVYYVKKAAGASTPSLYRRVFDGDTVGGIEQELIEGVETLQLRYGLDTTAPVPDNLIDGGYVTADAVGNWSNVVAVRMSLLVRSTAPIEGDVTPPPNGVLNGLTVTYPTSGAKFDRRIFTSTIAARNRGAF